MGEGMDSLALVSETEKIPERRFSLVAVLSRGTNRKTVNKATSA